METDSKFSKEIFIPGDIQNEIIGVYDANITKIEKNLDVEFSSHNGVNIFSGYEKNVKAACEVIDELIELRRGGQEISEQSVNYALSVVNNHSDIKISNLNSQVICHTVNGKIVVPKTLGQKNYVDNIKNKMITFGVGPAGTGKTYLAMAMAIEAFKKDEVMRIILTRPAIEAGEKLGFLPGDLQSKVDPYLRPLYDALYQIMGADQYQKNVEKGLIEVAPLAYMRGRTLDNSFIILDEAQNTTPAQMKMFLTRIGFGSKVVVTGDLSQKDLPDGAISGLDNSLKILKNIDEIGVSFLTAVDVVRHPLVQKIVKAYEKHEERLTKKKTNYKTQKYSK